MIVFKTFAKLTKKNFVNYGVFIIIFVLISILISQGYKGTSLMFEDRQYILGIVDHDKSKISEELVNYVKSSNNKVLIFSSERQLRDEIFKSKVNLGLIIEKGDMQAAISGKKPLNAIEDGVTGLGTLAFSDISKYITYMSASLSQGKSLDYARKIASEKVEVEMIKKDVDIDSYYENFFNVASYLAITVVISIGAFIMSDFNAKAVLQRNKVAAMRESKQLFFLNLGQFIMSVGIIAIPIIVIIVIAPGYLDLTRMLMLSFNLLLLIICSLSISFLINSITYNKNIITILMNLIPMGLSFISGVFVTRNVLGKTAITISKFTPVYYYVNAVGNIIEKSRFSLVDEVYILLFAALYLVIGVFIRSRKLQSAS